MKTLVFITSHFPFGKGETFIDSEFPFLARNFEKIIIIAQDVSGEKTRDIPESTIVYRYNTSTSFKGFFYIPVIFIINSQEIIKMVRDEITFRLRIDNKFSFRSFQQLVKKVFKAFQLSSFIQNKLAENNVRENIVFYSYWLKTGAHAISLLKYPGSIKISRAHGSDIYEEKSLSGYLPLMEFTADSLDSLFFISDNGKQYFSDKLKKDRAGFIVSRLGIENPYSGLSKNAPSEIFTIVSCSNMIPLKRIDLIIKALEITKAQKRIQWIHFGDGILRNELSELANGIPGRSGISYRFMGQVPNDELLKFYNQNRIDLFINTSSTEGIPVSIMEAQSAGIPVVATNVGGVSEIVVEGTGTLIQADFRISELAGLIEYYSGLSENEINEIRAKAIANWKKNYNAPLNYSNFVSNINSIFAATSKHTF